MDDRWWYELSVNKEGKPYHTYSVKAFEISLRLKVMCDMGVMCYSKKTFTNQLSDIVLGGMVSNHLLVFYACCRS